MSIIVSAASLVEMLRHQRLLSPAQEVELQKELLPRFPEPRALAHELLRRDWLTPFQLNYLFQGRGADLLLGQYLLLERLGESDLGKVFKAKHQHLKRLVTLRVIRPELLADAQAVRRFYQEIQAASQMSDPHVLHALDAGPVGNTHFFAMEYVEGIDLEQWMQGSGPVPVARVCELIDQIARGLHNAFERGLHHGNLCPANLLVTGTSAVLGTDAPADAPVQIKIRNLGLTVFKPLRRSGLSSAPVAGEGGETANFAAPELIGRDGEGDIRSDLYSLGCVFYFMLTGQVPFPGGTAADKLRRHQTEEPAPLEQRRPDVPPIVAATVRRLMARRPEERLQVPADVVVMLQGGEPRGLLTASGPRTPAGSRSAAATPPAFTRQASRETLVAQGSTLRQSGAPTAPPGAPTAPPGAPFSTQRLRKVRAERRWRFWVIAGALVLAAGVALVVFLTARQERPEAFSTDPKAPVTLAIEAGQSWQDTGVDVPIGASVTITAEGTWRKQGLSPCGGKGLDGQSRARVVVAEGQAMALVGRVGATETPFVLGTFRTIQTRTGGRLVLQANDLDLADNSGSLRVTIEGGRRSSAPAEPPTPTRAEAAEAALKLVLQREADPDSNRAELRDQAVDITRNYAGTAQALRAAGLLEQLPSPLDALDPAKVFPPERIQGEGGDPQRPPSELVTVLGERRLKHWREVQCVAFSPDGLILASGSNDQTVRLWDAATGKWLGTLSGHQDLVRAVAFSPDGKLLASASHDQTVKLWEPATSKELRGLRGHKQAVLAVAFRPDGQQLATGSADHTIKLWEPATGKEVRALAGHTNVVRGLAFKGDGQQLASASQDGTVKLWDLAAGKEIRTLTGHKGDVNSVAWSANGKTIASGSQDGTVKLWDAATGKDLSTLAANNGGVSSVAFRKDDQLLASGHEWNAIKLWDPATGKEARALGGHTGAILGLAFRGDGQVLATASADDTIKLWQADTGQELLPPAGHKQPVNSLAFRPDGQVLATSSPDGTIKLWDLLQGQEPRTLGGSQGAFYAVAYRPDGAWLASGGQDGTIALWEPATGKLVRTLGKHQAHVASLAFRNDGQVLASGSGDRSIKLWDTATGKELRTLTGHKNWVFTLAFAPDGLSLASGSDDGVKLWDVARGKELRVLTGHQARINALAFHGDGQLLASAGADGSVRLWEIGTGKELRSLRGHQGSVTTVAFRGDGRLLASSGQDSTVRFWNPLTGAEQQLLRLGPPGGTINQVVFSPAGRYLATANGNGTVYIVRLAPPGPSSERPSRDR